MRCPRAHILEAPPPLSLLLFRLVVVSMGISEVAFLGFFLAEALVAGAGGVAWVREVA